MASEKDAPLELTDSKSAVDQIEFRGEHSTAPPESGSDDMPAGYWRSFRFIGSILAIILLANGLFIGYVMPVNSLETRLCREHF